MSHRKRARLIERDPNANAVYTGATQTFPGRGYTQPFGAVYDHPTPSNAAAGTHYPGNTAYRGASETYKSGAAGAYNAIRDTQSVYDPAYGRAYDATQANSLYNVISNPNRPTNGQFDATTHGAYGTSRSIDLPDYERPPYGRYR